MTRWYWSWSAVDGKRPADVAGDGPHGLPLVADDGERGELLARDARRVVRGDDPPLVVDEDGRRGMAVDSMVSGGCIVSGATVRRSVLFSNVRVHDAALLEDCVVLPDVVIGPGVELRRAIVDRRVRLDTALLDGERRFRVTDKGITLITPEMLGQQVHQLR